ncbi:MAG TPA: 4-hydroxythreonine-4-phosphate dehydrogenase PdxA, partial [Victivallales bacterium]|nr:4-hydroxythreonine-4-phosphate dehydrogenase PdxA [Victivallales bacterium]
MKSVITMGDPNGVGPEILLKAYLEGKFPSNSFVVGDISVLRFCSKKIGLNVPFHICSHDNLKENVLNVFDMNIMQESDIEIGKISHKSGAASFEYIREASKMVIEKKADAIITLPVNKKAIMLTHPDFIGHTELIADMCGVSDYAMMIASDKLITTYVTTHLPIKDVVKFIKKERIFRVITLTDEVTKALRGFAKIAIVALNPHAGEEGAFGDEEINEIKPAIEMAKK